MPAETHPIHNSKPETVEDGPPRPSRFIMAAAIAAPKTEATVPDLLETARSALFIHGHSSMKTDTQCNPPYIGQVLQTTSFP